MLLVRAIQLELNVERLNDRIDTTLQAYATAIRNYGTLSQDALTLSESPERRRDLLKGIQPLLQLGGEDKYPYSDLEGEGREKRAARKVPFDRLWMGVVGGIAVFGPMILMVLERPTRTSLITVSAATMLFTLGLAFNAKTTSGKDVLAAVAAYAAVLVVFVGTST
ncbi:hypothetical protein G7Y89_g12652 [Cudoniella acicularis]|uniref:DUF6594 domain-containing protein n=1 Tax=Cudoniella acicularis TaxID=354080 RepID=A0A8H4VYY8_9HELO|nr:hypothetical protein G7Y89_g12652 [Cudoniella acicularis]